MSYKPRTISIGAKGSEPTDAEIKGRPIAVCDTSDLAASGCEVADQVVDMLTALREAEVPEPDVLAMEYRLRTPRPFSRIVGLGKAE